MLLEESEYKIITPAIDNGEEVDKVLHDIRQVKFICKECDMIIYVKHYDDIIKMEKTCNTCRKSKVAKDRSNALQESYMAKNAVVCNKCGHKNTRSKSMVGSAIRCYDCGSYDVYETNPTKKRK